MSRIVSGIQPTGNLHVGNWLGAVKNWVTLQNSGQYEMFIFIADLHSLSGQMSAGALRAQTLVTAAELISAGLDPKKTTLFIQSQVTGHAELGWIFNCLTPISELERMTQYKDKTAQFKQATAGLFTYPVLQAADILLYIGDRVPVGQDQVQHVELTRDIARWFNNKYGVYFPETAHLLTPVPKVMSLLEPQKKMSKSLGEGHALFLADEPETAEKKIKSAVTATLGGGSAPGVANLLLLLKEFTCLADDESRRGDKKVYEQFAAAEKNKTIRYAELKQALTDSFVKYFADFREKRAALLQNKSKLEKILAAGAKSAQKIADKTMEEVRKKVGLR